MNNNYIKSYVDVLGNTVDRKVLDRITMVFFAGLKFSFDRLLALLGLIILMPLILVISVLIKTDSKGPVLFKQVRTGKDGKNITVYKFRSMAVDNDVRDFSKADERTKVGAFLRKSSLDEIPQLISILKGDMSFIGPRPWITDYYDNMTDVQRHRSDVRPGLTGLAQVYGRNSISIFDKISYDLEYIKKYSLKQDVKIIFLTIKTVLTPEIADAGKAVISSELEDLKNQSKNSYKTEGVSLSWKKI